MNSADCSFFLELFMLFLVLLEMKLELMLDSF